MTKNKSTIKHMLTKDSRNKTPTSGRSGGDWNTGKSQTQPQKKESQGLLSKVYRRFNPKAPAPKGGLITHHPKPKEKRPGLLDALAALGDALSHFPAGGGGGLGGGGGEFPEIPFPEIIPPEEVLPPGIDAMTGADKKAKPKTTTKTPAPTRPTPAQLKTYQQMTPKQREDYAIAQIKAHPESYPPNDPRTKALIDYQKTPEANRARSQAITLWSRTPQEEKKMKDLDKQIQAAARRGDSAAKEKAEKEYIEAYKSVEKRTGAPVSTAPKTSKQKEREYAEKHYGAAGSAWLENYYARLNKSKTTPKPAPKAPPTKTKTSTTTAPRTQPKPAPKPAPKPKTTAKPAPKPITTTKPKVQAKPTTKPRVQPKPEPKPKTKPAPKPAPKAKPIKQAPKAPPKPTKRPTPKAAPRTQPSRTQPMKPK